MRYMAWLIQRLTWMVIVEFIITKFLNSDPNFGEKVQIAVFCALKKTATS